MKGTTVNRYISTLLAIIAAILLFSGTPNASAAAPKLKTYTAPNGEWSVQYPADLLHVEQLTPDVTIFISKDRHTVAALDAFAATTDATATVLAGRGQATLRKIYNKNVKNTGALTMPGARWETGFTFTTDKGSKGAALYHQNGRVDQDYRIFGFAYGYKAASEQTTQPLLQAIGESLKIYPPTVQRLDRARDAMRAYFGALYAGRYADGAKLYGGSYEILSGWNPDVAASDHTTLLQNGCEQNGLQCLRLKRIVSEKAVSANEFQFTVEFLNDAGKLFVKLGKTSRFTFTVKYADGKYLVQELPVYLA